MLLHQLLGRGDAKGKDVGIEIEVEGKRLPRIDPDNDNWVSEIDGSLRDGMEYIFNGAKSIDKVPVLLAELNDIFKGARSELKFSFRTSVHVHVNHLDCNITQLCNSIYTYMLLEPLLINFAGESRKANRFCLRVVDADGLVSTMKKVFSLGGDLGIAAIHHAFVDDENRYAAINIESLKKHGTIEIRCLRGTNDAEAITYWANVLVAARNWAKKQEDPKAIYRFLNRVGPDAFVDAVLGEYAEGLKYYGFENDMQYYQSITIDLPFSFVAEKQEEDKPKLVKQVGIKRANPFAEPAPVLWGNNPREIMQDDFQPREDF